MKVRNARLYNADGSAVPFVSTKNQSGKLKGGKPKFIVIHYTANPSGAATVNHFKNPNAKVSAHLVVGHAGDLTQMVKFDEKGWHAGTSSWKGLKGLNSYSVGIEIANWGILEGGAGSWKSWTGRALPDSRVIEAAHKNRPGKTFGWEIYDEAQIDATANAVRAIADAYGLGPQAVLGHDDISRTRKTDPGPAWKMDSFRALVFGRQEDDDGEEFYEVAAGSGLNMRVGPGVSFGKVKLLSSGAKVAVVERDGLWWLVAEIVGGSEDETGWVHSRWLAPA